MTIRMSRAVFEGMIGPDRKVIARGPFEVEVYEHHHARKTRWRARMIPTRFELKEESSKSRLPHPVERKTEAEMKIFVEFQFAKKVKDWRPGVIE